VLKPKKMPRACGLSNFLLTVSRYNSWHCRLHSCPLWINNVADFSRPQLQGTEKSGKSRHILSDMNQDGMSFSKELPRTCLVLLSELK